MTATVTVFADNTGQRITAARAMDLAEVARIMVTAKPAAKKDAAPLLKFATFGDVKSKGGSLRHDANVKSVTGIEGDYDGEQMPMAEAVERLRAAGVAALLHTSASHTPERPRWRVLCELATPLTGPPDELRTRRKQLVGTLNAILGGGLKSESFALSQTFYFGRIAGRPDPEIVPTTGVCIDQLANPPAPVFPLNGTEPAPPHDVHADGEVGADRSADLFGRVCRDVRAKLADYEIRARHRRHPKVAAMPDAEADRHLALAIRNARTKLRIAEPVVTEDGDIVAPFSLSVVHTVAEYNKLDIPKREPIVEGLLLTQMLAMLFAIRGLGKTMVALYLAVCVARGGKFFEWCVPAPRQVLYVDGEMSGAELQERLRKFVGSDTPALLDVIASETFYQLEDAPLNIANIVHQERFVGLLDGLEARGRRPALIIFDNKSALSAGADENSNTEQDASLAFLRRLRHRGHAVMVVHHAGKSGDQRGASRNEDFLDLTIKLVEPGDGKEGKGDEFVPQGARGAAFKLTFTKHRSLRPDPASLGVELMEDVDGSFTWAIQKPRRQQNWLRVLIYLYDHPLDVQAAVGEALAIDKSNMSGHVKTLRGRNFLKDGTLELTPSARSYVESVRAGTAESGGLDA